MFPLSLPRYVFFIKLTFNKTNQGKCSTFCRIQPQDFVMVKLKEGRKEKTYVAKVFHCFNINQSVN